MTTTHMRCVTAFMSITAIMLLALTNPAAGNRFFNSFNERDLAQYAQLLELSAEQRDAAHAFYREYMDQRRADPVGAQLQAYRRQRDIAFGEVNSAEERGEDPGEVAARLYGDLAREARRIIPVLNEIEDAFFANLESILTEAQQPRMELVRRWRQRQYHRNFLGGLPGAEVDIFDLIAEIMPPHRLTPERIEVMDAYEPRYVTALTRTAGMESLMGSERYRRITIRWLLSDDSLPPADREALSRELSAIDISMSRRFLNAANEIRRLNEEVIDAAIAFMDDDAHAELVDRYRRLCHPDVYPDPAALHVRRTFAAALALDLIEPFQIEEIERRLASFDRDHERLSQQLAELEVEHRRTRVAIAYDDRWQLDALVARSREVRDERTALCMRQRDFLQTILYADQFAELPEWPDSFPRRPVPPRDPRDMR